MKKIFLVVFAVVLTAASCNSKPAQNPEDKTSEDKVVKMKPKGLGGNGQEISYESYETAIITKDDKIYKNESLGFAVTYPGNWYMNIGEDMNPAYHDFALLPVGKTMEDDAQSIQITVIENGNEDSFIADIMRIDAPRTKTVSASKLGGKNANSYKISPQGGSAPYFRNILVTKQGSNLYVLSCVDNMQSSCDIVMFNKIAQNIKFLNQSSSLEYKNSVYGFQVTLTSVWKGYRVIQRTDTVYPNVKYLDFEVPTKDTNYGNNTGYAAPLIIAIYPKADWSKVSQEGGPIPTKISENNQYVFAYSGWQEPPSDLRNVDFGINQIVAGFNLTK